MTTKPKKDCTTCHSESWSKSDYADSKTHSYSPCRTSEKTVTTSSIVTVHKGYHAVYFSRGAANDVSVSYNSKSAEKKKLISELNKKFGQ